MHARLIAVALLAILSIFSFTVLYTYMLRGTERITLYTGTSMGVPYIKGSSDEDAMYGLGYAQAEDHLQDMVWNFLTVDGRLSEYFGENM